MSEYQITEQQEYYHKMNSIRYPNMTFQHIIKNSQRRKYISVSKQIG